MGRQIFGVLLWVDSGYRYMVGCRNGIICGGGVHGIVDVYYAPTGSTPGSRFAGPNPSIVVGVGSASKEVGVSVSTRSSPRGFG